MARSLLFLALIALAVGTTINLNFYNKTEKEDVKREPKCEKITATVWDAFLNPLRSSLGEVLQVLPGVLRKELSGDLTCISEVFDPTQIVPLVQQSIKQNFPYQYTAPKANEIFSCGNGCKKEDAEAMRACLTPCEGFRPFGYLGMLTCIARTCPLRTINSECSLCYEKNFIYAGMTAKAATDLCGALPLGGKHLAACNIGDGNPGIIFGSKKPLANVETLSFQAVSSARGAVYGQYPLDDGSFAHVICTRLLDVATSDFFEGSNLPPITEKMWLNQANSIVQLLHKKGALSGKEPLIFLGGLASGPVTANTDGYRPNLYQRLADQLDADNHYLETVDKCTECPDTNINAGRNSSIASHVFSRNLKGLYSRRRFDTPLPIPSTYLSRGFGVTTEFCH